MTQQSLHFFIVPPPKTNPMPRSSAMSRNDTAELTAANDGNLFRHGSTLPRREALVGATLRHRAPRRSIPLLQQAKGATI